MKNFTGFIIRQQRLQKGLSQEALCRGICAVSYLSKIEQGIGNPSPAILQQLFETLGIRYAKNEQLLEKASTMLQGYFDKFFHGEAAEDEASYLNLHQAELEESELHLDWHLFNLFRLMQKQGKSASICRQEAAYLGKFTDNMETNQLFLYYLGFGLLPSEQQTELLQKAEAIHPTGFVRQSMAECHFAARRYMDAIRMADLAYTTAAEEGNVSVLLWSSYLLGACYSQFNDMTFMLKYYHRASELSRGFNPMITGRIQYNIGSAYMEHAMHREAVPYLLSSIKASEALQDDRLVAARQKLAICYFEQGHAAFGNRALQQAKAGMAGPMRAVHEDISALIRMRYTEENTETRAYEELLESLYRRGDEVLGEGWQRIFYHYLDELYCAQRRYKEALTLARDNKLL